MPVGVQVTTDVLQPAGGLDTADSAALFAVGITERGDTSAPVLVRSMREYRDKLGDRVTYGSVDDAASCYFGEGGSRLFVKRLVGSSATKGTLTLVDRAGTPLSTLRIDAQNAGAWSQRVTITVTDGIPPSTFTITVKYDGAVKEVYSNLASPAAAVTALGNSTYVRGADLGSVTAAPNNNPAVVANSTLTAGGDDRGTLAAADYVTGLAAFTAEFGPGSVAVPGQSASNATISAGILTHANTYRRIGLLAPAVGQSVSTLTALALTLRNSTGADSCGLFYPWVAMPDGIGGSRLVPPEGFIAGVRARAILSNGWPTPPFGENGQAQFVLGTETFLTNVDTGTLADGAVNPIKAMRNIGGVRLYDWRSLSYDEANWKFLDYRDLLYAIAAEASDLMERHVGEPIDGAGHLFTAMEADAESVLAPMSQAGRLYAKFDTDGNQVDPGYQLITDDTVNTPDTISRGEAHIRINVRPSPDAELISIQVSKATLQNAL